MGWQINGQYFEACNCETACPCVFLSPPTEGECTAIVGWHIEDGDHDGTDLDGLNVALAVYSPGPMTEVDWQAALYLDASATQEQAAALGAIFSGAEGGHPAVLGSHIGEVLGVASAPIWFEVDGDSRAMTVGDAIDVRVTAMAGHGDQPVTITNHPLSIAPGVAHVGHSDHLRMTDHGFAWELSDRNGFFSPFAYEG